METTTTPSFVHWDLRNPNLDDEDEDMLALHEYQGTYRDDEATPPNTVFRSTPSSALGFTPVFHHQPQDDEPTMVVRKALDDPDHKKKMLSEFSSLADKFPLPDKVIIKKEPQPEQCHDDELTPIRPYPPVDDGTITPKRERIDYMAPFPGHPASGGGKLVDPHATQPTTCSSITYGGPMVHKNEIQDLQQVYCVQLTGEQAAEIEQLRWEIQQSVFMRYQELTQQEAQWGRMEERDGSVFFVPGQRREAILREKKYHQHCLQESIKAGGDVTWYQARLHEVEKLYKQFTCEEVDFKRKLSLARLEKKSPFATFPTLANRFVLVRLLGKGGNGEVWHVLDYLNNKQQCALKISTSRIHARREHAKHMSLRHQHIAMVGDAAFTISHNGKLYEAFTLENVHTDLHHMIELCGGLEESPSALRWLYQLISALSYLHEQGIAHYDIKPSNILVDQFDCVKLTDFDLARPASAPAINSDEGTLRFLPPECFGVQYVDASECTAARADMWMVGIVFYLMLFGCHPLYREKCSADDMRQFFTSYNGTQLKRLESLSPLAQSILRGCLHPDPRCRPTALQILDALRQYAEQQQYHQQQHQQQHP